MSYRITGDCIGCTICAKNCPVGAITGASKELHHINPALCIECGACGRLCPSSAVRDGAGRTPARLKKNLWRKPLIDTEKCYACENCVAACPVDALSMLSEVLPLSRNYAVLSKAAECVSCGWCVQNCQFDAIRMEDADAGN